MKKESKYELPRKRRGESQSRYLGRVYNLNKEKIVSAYERYTGISDNTTIRRNFKKLVKEYTDEGLYLKEATKKVLNKEMFVPIQERYQQNIYKAIKSDKDIYKEFRNLTKVKINNKKLYSEIDLKNFEYRGSITHEQNNYTAYSYTNSGGTTYIYIGNSPKGEEQSSIRVTAENWMV